MEFKEIVVVTGEPGLFQLVSSKNDGAIVRTLDGLSTKFVPSRLHQFTPLESIEVFTTGENVSLMEIFRAMLSQESDTAVIGSNQGTTEIKAYFDKVYPELDESRVYLSDMKKMLKWYPLLKQHDLITEAPDEEPSAPEATGSEDAGTREAQQGSDASGTPGATAGAEAQKPAAKDKSTEKKKPAAKETGNNKAKGGAASAAAASRPTPKQSGPKKAAGKKPGTEKKG